MSSTGTNTSRRILAACLRPPALVAVAALLPLASAHADVVAHGAERIVSGESGAAAFGIAVQALDFDGDGVDEIAISDPAEAVAGGSARGVVRIFRRTATGWQAFAQADLNAGSALFGLRLASGDFDGDGRDDLLIGAPGYGNGGGAVYLLRHVSVGTTVLANPIAHASANFGQCGASLAVGDFNDDGHLDFVTGCPTASFDAHSSVGRIQIARGFGNGVFSTGSYLSQASPGVGGGPETGDRFGAALATGDFNCDGVHDLAVGVPGESVDGGIETGALHVLFGSVSNGLTGAGSQLWHQGSAGIPGTSGDGDGFASALAAANFDGSHACDDLAIGIPDDAENPGGAVLVLDASATGLVAAGARLITALDLAPDPNGSPHPAPGGGHRIGVSLATAQMRQTMRTDLVIGVKGYTLIGVTQPGLVCLAQSDGQHPMGAGHRCFSGRQFPGGAATDTSFGLALAALDTGGEDREELAIGAYATTQVFVLRNVLFRDGFEYAF